VSKGNYGRHRISFTGGGHSYEYAMAETETNNLDLSSDSSFENQFGGRGQFALSFPGPLGSTVELTLQPTLATVDNAEWVVTQICRSHLALLAVNGEASHSACIVGCRYGTETTEETAKGFTLSDSHIGDVFEIELYVDPVYGTTVFKTIGGQSRCPHEIGTEARERFDLELADGLKKDTLFSKGEESIAFDLYERIVVCPVMSAYSVVTPLPPCADTEVALDRAERVSVTFKLTVSLDRYIKNTSPTKESLGIFIYIDPGTNKFDVDSEQGGDIYIVTNQRIDGLNNGYSLPPLPYVVDSCSVVCLC